MKRRALFGVLIIALVSCAGDSETPSTPAAVVSAEATARDSIEPAIEGSGETTATEALAEQAGKPTTPAGDSEAASVQIRGTVLESTSVAGFTYVRLKTSDGEMWAVVNQPGVDVGAEISMSSDLVMRDFESKELGKRFDTIIFGRLVGGESAVSSSAANEGRTSAPARPPAGAAGGRNPHADVARVDTDDTFLDVQPVEGGRTISALWSARKELDGKVVKVRGKVVKFNPGIIGRNWLHLRDGSGESAKGDHDLTVTTTEMLSVGEVVTMSGLVRTDQDLGSGFVYGLIVVDAEVIR